MGGFHPHLTLAQELRGGSDFGGSRGTYLELGVEPTYQLTDKLRLSGPVSLGLSLNNYYELANGDDDMFGFLSIGVHAQAPMDFMPTRFGPWQLDFGLDLLFLGDNTEAMNGGDAVEVILGIGAAVRW
jgi:hypothetical protein